jgi:hypothetical protein
VETEIVLGRNAIAFGHIAIKNFSPRPGRKFEPSHSDAARVKISGKIKNKTSAGLFHFFCSCPDNVRRKFERAQTFARKNIFTVLIHADREIFHFVAFAGVNARGTG